MLIVSLREEHFGVTFPEPCIRLLKALASDKPVCAIVPPVREVKDLLIRIANGANPKDNPFCRAAKPHTCFVWGNGRQSVQSFY